MPVGILVIIAVTDHAASFDELVIGDRRHPVSRRERGDLLGHPAGEWLGTDNQALLFGDGGERRIDVCLPAWAKDTAMAAGRVSTLQS